jgi:2-polyprenyl-3-methyl-5-hydroxy-6-metoxy-1,4-benzoquinol methylase
MQQIDEQKLKALLDKVTSDIGVSLSSALVFIGQKLGLYKAMANAGPLSIAEIAARSGTVERYVREWLINQVAIGYIEYDSTSDKYFLPPEQALLLSDEKSPLFVGGFYIVKALMQAVDRVSDSFIKGGGVDWSEHDPDLYFGTESSLAPYYSTYLTTTWIPALEGIEKKLNEGGKIADVGCGRGASTLIMARRFRNSKIYGFDNHGPSMEYARKAAIRAGVANHTLFEVADSDSFPDGPYDLITFCFCLHDMPDPVATAKRAFETLADNGSVLLMEPNAADTVDGNKGPVGQILSGVSTLCCLTSSIAQGGSGLGAVVTEKRLRDTLSVAGFTFFRRIGEALLIRAYEARK